MYVILQMKMLFPERVKDTLYSYNLCSYFQVINVDWIKIWNKNHKHQDTYEFNFDENGNGTSHRKVIRSHKFNTKREPVEHSRSCKHLELGR